MRGSEKPHGYDLAQALGPQRSRRRPEQQDLLEWGQMYDSAPVLQVFTPRDLKHFLFGRSLIHQASGIEYPTPSVETLDRSAGSHFGLGFLNPCRPASVPKLDSIRPNSRVVLLCCMQEIGRPGFLLFVSQHLPNILLTFHLLT